MDELPSGTVTFLLTDIEEGSPARAPARPSVRGAGPPVQGVGVTRLWQQHPEAMRAALERHGALLEEHVGGHGGGSVHRVGHRMSGWNADMTGPSKPHERPPR